MLGVCLLFVGIVLINNGMCTFYQVDGKSAAVMNILTGGLSIFINAVNLVLETITPLEPACFSGSLICSWPSSNFRSWTPSLLPGSPPSWQSTL